MIAAAEKKRIAKSEMDIIADTVCTNKCHYPGLTLSLSHP